MSNASPLINVRSRKRKRRLGGGGADGTELPETEQSLVQLRRPVQSAFCASPSKQRICVPLQVTPVFLEIGEFSAAIMNVWDLSRRVLMASLLVWSVTMTAVVILSGVTVLLFLYRKSGAPQAGGGATPGEKATSATLVATEQHASSTLPANKTPPETFWPRTKAVDLEDRDSDSGRRARRRSSSLKPQRPAAPGRVRGHLPHVPNSRFPRGSRLNALSPAGPRQVFDGMFHLNLIFRRDDQLHVHWTLNLGANADGRQVQPAAWIAHGNGPHRDAGWRRFREPGGHVDVGVLQRSSDTWSSHNCFMRTSSCRFYLRLHRDHVTQPFRAPARFAAGRRNPENAAPSVPAVYEGAVPDAAKLAQLLLSFDPEHRMLMSFFKWKLFYNGRRGRAEERAAFLCQA